MSTSPAILIDSCILSNLLTKKKELVAKTEELLEELQKDHTLYISEFTRYELFRNTTSEQQEKTEAVLQGIEEVPNNKDRLDRAILLHTAYASNPKTKNILHSISDVDIFIGALVFTEQQPYLLTADYADFPRPFFTEEKMWEIEFRNRNRGYTSIYYYLLRANIQSITSSLG